MINAVKDINIKVHTRSFDHFLARFWPKKYSESYLYGMLIFIVIFLGTQGQQIIMVSSAGGLKQISGATMSQAGLSQLSGGGPGGVKMVVVSSGQLAQAQNTKPITISMPGTGSQKTVTLSGTVYVF